MASFRPILVLALLLPALAGPASAQDPGSQPPPPAGFESVFVNDTQVWDTPRNVSGILYITSTGNLTIDGTTVNLRYLAVDPGARLVLKSKPDAPARLVPADDSGWQGDVLGTLEARGLPEVPVRLNGMRGQASRADTTILFSGAFHLGGEATFRNVIFENYTAGLMVAEGARLDADRVAFGSRAGLGLVVHGGAADVANATFRDAGGGVFVTRAGGFLNLTDATFEGGASPIVTLGHRLGLRNVSVSSSGFCVEAYAGVVDVAGFRCRGFSKAGIRALGGPNLLDITIEDADISTTNETSEAGHGIDLDRVRSATVARTRLGPLPGHGIVEKRTPARLDNVTAEGVRRFNEVVFDAPNGTTVDARVKGSPGGNGWLEAYWTPRPKVVFENGSLAPNATVTYYQWRTQTVLLSHTVNDPTGNAPPASPLRALVVVPNGTKVVVLYTVVAQSEDGQQNASLEFTPNADELVLRLKPDEGAPPRRIPGVVAWMVVVAVALAIGGQRRS